MPDYQTPNVYIEQVPSSGKPIQGSSSGIAAFIGIAEKGPIGVATLITNFNEYKTIFGGHITNGYLSYSVENFFIEAGTGSKVYVTRTAHYEDITDASTLTAEAATISLKSADATDVIKADVIYPGTDGNKYSIEIAAASYSTDANAFDVNIYYDNGKSPIYSLYDATMATIDGKVIGEIRLTKLDESRPDNVKENFAGGTDGLIGLSDSDYIGSAASETGLYSFDRISENLNIAIPGVTTRAVQVAGSAYAENKTTSQFLTELPLGLSYTEAKAYKTATGEYSTEAALNSAHTCIFYPWYQIKDPLTGNKKLVPTSAAMAGVFSRTASTRGVHKAPAGAVDGRLKSAIGIERIVTDTQQSELNPVGVNVIRAFPEEGIVCWGARTASSDPEWRYTNVRLLISHIAASLQKGTRWAVFEPNDEILWGKIRIAANTFLNKEYKKGAFFDGGTGSPEDAYYVICDSTVNTQAVIDAGQVVTEIGVAPSKPGEFIRFRISQWDGGRLIEQL